MLSSFCYSNIHLSVFTLVSLESYLEMSVSSKSFEIELTYFSFFSTTGPLDCPDETSDKPTKRKLLNVPFTEVGTYLALATKV